MTLAKELDSARIPWVFETYSTSLFHVVMCWELIVMDLRHKLSLDDF